MSFTVFFRIVNTQKRELISIVNNEAPPEMGEAVLMFLDRVPAEGETIKFRSRLARQSPTEFASSNEPSMIGYNDPLANVLDNFYKVKEVAQEIYFPDSLFSLPQRIQPEESEQKPAYIVFITPA